jgi:8-oxo-dGTP diphosphatase
MTGPPSYCLGFAFDIPDVRPDGIEPTTLLANQGIRQHHGPRVALIEKIKPEWQAGRLNGIGGMIEEFDRGTGHGASRVGLNAMVREFQEETGYQTEVSDWSHFHTMGSEEWQVECFRAFSIPLEELKTTTDEEVICTTALYLPHNVLWNLRFLIPLALDHQPLPTMQVYR